MTDDELVAVIREAVIRENMRWEGMDPTGPLGGRGSLWSVERLAFSRLRSACGCQRA